MVTAKKSASGWAGVTPNIEVKQSNRTLSVPNWNTTALSHWKNVSPEVRKKHNVSMSISSPRNRPLGSLYIFPSLDPYTSRQRAEFRLIHENISWINRALRIMVACVTGWGYTISVEPRTEDEHLEDEALDKWKAQQKFSLPGIDMMMDETESKEENQGGMSALDIEKFLFNYSVTMDLQPHLARCYRYTLEQGNCGLAMLPEYKFNKEGEIDDKNGKYIMPKVLRTIRPEHTVKIWLDMNTGEMSSLQIIGLASNGGKLPAERLVWFMSDFNLELNTDYYGESRLLPLLDPGKTMGILYAKDFPEAAQFTWHQPKVFQVQIPPRDYKKVTEVLKNFLRKNNNSQGRDIAVTQSVELISGSTNSGDISGLLAMDDHLIDQIAGFFNIPPFLMSKGKAGNLGGNAQKEEVDAFLNVEVRPQQEILENFAEKQFFDRLLQIMFDEEDVDAIPIRVRMHMMKPDLATLFNKEQYEILLDMVGRKLLSEDKMMERLNINDMSRGITKSSGGDADPSRNVWPRWPKKANPHWRGTTSWKNNGSPPQWNSRPEVKLTTSAETDKNKAPVSWK